MLYLTSYGVDREAILTATGELDEDAAFIEAMGIVDYIDPRQGHPVSLSEIVRDFEGTILADSLRTAIDEGRFEEYAPTHRFHVVA